MKISQLIFKCIACQENNLNMNNTNKVVCTNCNAKYINEADIPMLVGDINKIKNDIHNSQNINPKWYLQEQPEHETSRWRHHLKKRKIYVETIIDKYLEENNVKKAENILDLGCGDGNNLSFLSKYGKKLFGSDYNFTRLKRAKYKHLSANLFLADINNYPVSDNSFDIIFFNHVLEHIPNDNKALEVVYKILKPGGLLILGIPNEGAGWWQFAYKLEPYTLRNTDHLHFYTSKSITKKLIANEFDILEVEHLGYGPPCWSLDAMIRKYKIVDDLFENIGKLFFKYQSSSLYIICTKK